MPVSESPNYVKVYSALTVPLLRDISEISDRWGMKEQEIFRLLLILGWCNDDKKITVGGSGGDRIYFRIPSGIYKSLKNLSDEHNLSLGVLIRYYIEKGLLRVAKKDD